MLDDQSETLMRQSSRSHVKPRMLLQLDDVKLYSNELTSALVTDSSESDRQVKEPPLLTVEDASPDPFVQVSRSQRTSAKRSHRQIKAPPMLELTSTHSKKQSSYAVLSNR